MDRRIAEAHKLHDQELEANYDATLQLRELVGEMIVTMMKISTAANLAACSSGSARVKLDELVEMIDQAIRYELVAKIKNDLRYHDGAPISVGYSRVVMDRITEMMDHYSQTVMPNTDEDFTPDLGFDGEGADRYTSTVQPESRYDPVERAVSEAEDLWDDLDREAGP
jgi:hypothetical protein